MYQEEGAGSCSGGGWLWDRGWAGLLAGQELLGHRLGGGGVHSHQEGGHHVWYCQGDSCHQCGIG